MVTTVKPVLRVDSLSIALPQGADRPLAVEQLGFSIAAGRTLCIVGESGSGKSVMASAVMGLLPSALRPVGGSVLLEGEELLQAGEARLRALRGVRMGMVFQEPMTALNPVMRCGRQLDELLCEHTSRRDWPAARRQRRVLDLFERVRLPDPERIYRSYPHQLSGGQRQRIVIAMAMLMQPKLLICDEPTTALDVTTQKEILKLIGELRQTEGAAVLFITHDMGVVAEIADDVLVMQHGKAVEYGPCRQVLSRPSAAYTAALCAAVPSMTPPAPRVVQDGAPLLAATAVGKTYVSHNWMGRRRETVALAEASLAVRNGETVGIVGESGCGKTTFARCLMRLIEPSVGSIKWGGDEVAKLPEGRLRPLRSRVQVIFQDPNRSLNPRRRVCDSIIEGALNFGVPQDEARALAVRLMEQVRLPAAGLQRYPHEFSGGQRQRIAIARALASRPQVLIADEAVSALDVSVQAQILQLLREVQQQYRVGIVFITHDLRVAAQMCDRVVVMLKGRIVEQGRTADVYAAPSHEYTQCLMQAAPRPLSALGSGEGGEILRPGEATVP
jgi:peptide/nickel transport system ATP-binding protein